MNKVLLFEKVCLSAGLSRNHHDALARRLGVYGARETLEAIAQTYGVTREAIRLREAKAWSKVGQAERAQLEAAFTIPPPVKLPGKRLYLKWMREAGYRQCYLCKLWKPVGPLDLYPDGIAGKDTNHKCRPCVAKSVREYYAANPKARERQKVYQRAHLEYFREYARRPQVRQRLQQRFKDRYAADPTFREKVLAKGRLQYQKKKGAA